ncbi:hypothetical protein NBRC116494_09520 [Aurantivibrio plasticivorans]
MIRMFTSADLKATSRLYVDVFAGPPWNERWTIDWALDRLTMIFQSPGFLGHVYEVNGKIVGVIAGRSNSFKGRRELEIVELFVSKRCQSDGVGKALLSAIEEQAGNNGYSHSVLLTSQRVPAFNFYLRRGYRANADMVMMSRAL